MKTFNHENTLGVKETINYIENKLTSGAYQFTVPNSMFGSILVKEDGEDFDIFNPTTAKCGIKTDYIVVIPFCKYPSARHYYIIESIMKVALLATMGSIRDDYTTALSITYLEEVERKYYPHGILLDELTTHMSLFTRFDRVAMEGNRRYFYGKYKEAAAVIKQAKTMSVGNVEGLSIYPELTRTLRGICIMNRNEALKDSGREIMNLLTQSI